MKEHSIFWPLTLIATGVVWLLIGMGIIPASNLWALTHLLPFVLIGLGMGLILRAYWRFAGILASLFIVGGAVLAIVFAPQLSWDSGPALGWNIGSDGFGGGVAGSGEIKTETRKVSGFEGVSIGYPAKVTIRQGNTESVVLKGDDNVLPQIRTEIIDDVLYVDGSDANWDDRVKPSQIVEIIITVRDLNKVVFPSAGSLLIEDLTTDSLELVVSGAGEINLSGLVVDRSDIKLSGAGNIHANGVVGILSVRISGFGEFDGGDLHSQTAEVRITGAGSATVWTDKNLDATISGAGSVNYYGNPTVHEQISGAGSVKDLGEK